MRFKQPKPSKHSGKYRQYSKEKLLKAYEDVTKNGTSVRKASAIYGVPYATLVDRVAGRVQAGVMKNEETLFTREEELGIVEYLETFAQLGYGVTSSKIKNVAGDLAFQLGKRRHNKILSNRWLKNFLKRWESRISSVKPSSLETSRAKSSTPETVDKYFTNLRKTIEENDLLNKPQFIYNVDETGIQPEHRPPNIIAPVHEKAHAVTSPRSTTTTIIGCVNAIGNAIPPFFIFKGKRLNPDLMKGSSPGAGYTMSESGWSNAQVFREYLEDHFLPNVRRGLNDNQPIILIFDGHTSHTSKSLIEWAVSKNIILFVLPAHTSHLLQPLDVAVFGPFKGYYYRECATYMRENIGQSITRYHMADIACKAYLKAATPNNIVSAFKKTGIFPLNSEAIDHNKLFPCEAFRDTTPIEKLKAIKSGKEAVDEYLKVKYEETQATPVKSCSCNCSCKATTNTTKRPSSSGKEITDNTFIEEMNAYEQEKNQTVNKQTNKRKQNVNKQTNKKVTENDKSAKKSKGNVCTSPKPSTSGVSNTHATTIQSDTSDDEMDDSEVCCVCKKFYPPADNKPFLKIVNWAFCDKCSHSVHLSFCHEKRAIRRGETFLCPHCV